MTGALVLIRHGESEWNARNLFTGWRDIGLSPRGRAQARAAGRRLAARSVRFDLAFASALIRAQETCTLVLREVGQPALAMRCAAALNERDYGGLSGMDKDAARAKWGAEQVHRWRRGWADRPPGGESLKDTAARVSDCYEQEIAPELEKGRTILICAHGNSLRALVQKLEEIPVEEISGLNIATGEIYLYRIGAGGQVRERKILPPEEA